MKNVIIDETRPNCDANEQQDAQGKRQIHRWRLKKLSASSKEEGDIRKPQSKDKRQHHSESTVHPALALRGFRSHVFLVKDLLLYYYCYYYYCRKFAAIVWFLVSKKLKELCFSICMIANIITRLQKLLSLENANGGKRGSPIGFFNPAIPDKFFPQSRNPDRCFSPIPIPVSSQLSSSPLPQRKI